MARACPGEGRGQGAGAVRVRLQSLSGNPGDQAPKPALAKAGGGQFVLHAKALHGNPFDGHTLGPVVTELEQLTGVETRRIHVDKSLPLRKQGVIAATITGTNSASGSPAKCAG